jgi:hypothetical protein
MLFWEDNENEDSNDGELVNLRIPLRVNAKLLVISGDSTKR